CNNAFDAMRDKQAAPVETDSQTGSEHNRPGPDSGSEPYRPGLTIRTLRNNSTVTIEFEDNGPGIPDDIKDKILQPFFTTKKGTDGTGLGLSITNDIIKAHGGTLDIESEFGKYTTFKIHLT
ncbi:MAG: HAMP domain-containing histidine kinase, partial [Rhodothermaceae bacterium]|nr:HAMP domain-containing histidine kinase [Rhodothermaceae bacterium]